MRSACNTFDYLVTNVYYKDFGGGHADQHPDFLNAKATAVGLFYLFCYGRQITNVVGTKIEPNPQQCPKVS